MGCKTVLSILIIVFIFSSCKKEKNPFRQLVGKWQWVSTRGGIAFNIHDTPASTGKEVQLDFSKDARYFIYTNGILSSSGIFTLVQKKCIHDGTNKPFIHFSNNEDQMIHLLNNTDLEVSDEAADGVGSIYVRLN